MKYVLLFLIPLLALAKPAAKKPAPKRVATKVSSGKQICQMIEKIAATGIPQQTNIDFAPGGKEIILGKVGAIDKNIGTFHIGNLYFRALATGTEGQVYDPKCIAISFPDLDKDGVKDLQISVAVQTLDPKANPAVVSTQQYERTFLYRQAEKIYQPISGSPNPFVELLIR